MYFPEKDSFRESIFLENEQNKQITQPMTEDLNNHFRENRKKF